jgi:arginine/serine-rich splicing factor 17
VLKATLEFIRCEAEIENKSSFKNLLSKIDNMVIKMSGGNSLSDLLKVRAAEAKLVYPNRYEWESFYKEDGNSDIPIEQKNPGERPDTVHIVDLPCRWFAEKKHQYSSDASTIKPSENVIREVFSIFGEIRLVDMIVHAAAYKKQATSATDLLFASGAGLNVPTFEAFIQYKDYISFVKAMDTFRGMKLLFMDEIERAAYTANMKVDFDRTRHLSDKEIQRRKIEGYKNVEIEKIKTAQTEKEREKETKQREIAK